MASAQKSLTFLLNYLTSITACWQCWPNKGPPQTEEAALLPDGGSVLGTFGLAQTGKPSTWRFEADLNSHSTTQCASQSLHATHEKLEDESGVSQPEDRSCCVVWWYGSGYFCMFCQAAAGRTDCDYGGCCLLVPLRLYSDPSLHNYHWCSVGGYWWCSGWFSSPPAEPSFRGPSTNHATLGCFQSGCFPLLPCKS